MKKTKICRVAQKLALVTWICGCIAAYLLISGHRQVEFQMQDVAVRYGTYLALACFVFAASFSVLLLLMSFRSKTLKLALDLLPYAYDDISERAFRVSFAMSTISFLFLSLLVYSLVAR